MFPPPSFSTVLHPMGLFSLLLGLLFLLLIFSLILATSLTREAAKPQAVGEAIYCYLVQSIGIILMSIGALPTLYSVLTRAPLQSLTYSALLFVFSIGGLVFLWHDYLVQRLPSSSRTVPAAIYLSTWKFIGFALLLFALLSLILKILLLRGAVSPPSFALHGVLALYGLILWWSTQATGTSPSGFSQKTISFPPPMRKQRKRKG